MKSTPLFLFLQTIFCSTSGFRITQSKQSAEIARDGDTVTLLCKTDDYYEYCSWTHNRRKCDFEWKRAHGKVLKQGCHDDLRHRVSIVGHYNNHECGLQIKNFSVDEDAGQWLCEMEEYKFGGSRGHVSEKYLTVRAPATTTTTTSTTTEITRTTTTTTEEELTTTEVEMTTNEVTTATDSDDIYGDDDEEDQEEDNQSVEDEEEQDITTEASDDNSDEQYDEYEYEDIMRILEINGTKTADNIHSPEQQIDQPGSSVVGVVCGVVVAVLATAAVVGAVLVWRRRRRDQGVITMSKILEESEARGAILEEAEYHANTRIAETS